MKLVTPDDRHDWKYFAAAALSSRVDADTAARAANQMMVHYQQACDVPEAKPDAAAGAFDAALKKVEDAGVLVFLPDDKTGDEYAVAHLESLGYFIVPPNGLIPIKDDPNHKYWIADIRARLAAVGYAVIPLVPEQVPQ